MKKHNLRSIKFLLILLVALLLGATSLWALDYIPKLLEREETQDEYEELAKEYVAIKTPYPSGPSDTSKTNMSVTPDDVSVDISALKNENSDVVAWIYIPGTGINYPVVQSSNNETYVRRGFDGNYSDLGTLFLDFANSSDFSDNNSIIYGHNVYDGGNKMFTDLIKYKDREYYLEHPVIHLVTPDGERTYRIFAVCHFDITAIDQAAFYKQDFRSEDHMSEYIANLIRNALYDTNIIPSSNLLTLSTCDKSIYGDNGRVIVVGHLE